MDVFGATSLSLPMLFLFALDPGAAAGSLFVGGAAWAGLAGLLAGTVIGIRGRHKRLLWFCLSPLLSHLLALSAWQLRGQVGDGTAMAAVGLFLLAQILLLVFLTLRLRGLRLASLALSLFAAVYAVIASLVAGTSFAYA